MDIPSNTIDLINILKQKYNDEFILDPAVVGTSEYWKKAGVIELLRELEYFIKNKGT